MKKLLSQKQIDFYGKLEWQGKSKRLRKKARTIINIDGYIRYGYVNKNGKWIKSGNIEGGMINE